eukprot:1828215-Prymnesium_polylepis.1
MLRRSFSFSGAGFLGAYHVGVATALQSAGLLPDYYSGTRKSSSAEPPMLLGASAGALTAGAVVAGALSPTRSAEIMDLVTGLAVQARAQPLNALTPGFSLIDRLWPRLTEELEGAEKRNPDSFLQRIAAGDLRVSLTTPGPSFLVRRERAHRVVDRFESCEHLTSALILSSFVPGVTGPLIPAAGSAASRARQVLESAWGVMSCLEDDDAGSLDPVPPQAGQVAFIDGGLSEMWPRRDAATVIVSPLAVRASRGVICPRVESSRS